MIGVRCFLSICEPRVTAYRPNSKHPFFSDTLVFNRTQHVHRIIIYIHIHDLLRIYIYTIYVYTQVIGYIYILYIYLHLHNPCFLSGLPLNPRSYHFGILNPGSSFKTPGFPKIQGPNQIKPLPRRCRIKDILTRATNMGYVWVPTYI